MNNNTSENSNVQNEAPVLMPTTEEPKKEEVAGGAEVLKEESTEVLNEAAQAIVEQAEVETAKAANAYENREVVVAPKQDRIQLVDDKPKLHAVQFNGVTVPTESKVEDATEVLEVVDPNQTTEKNIDDKSEKPKKEKSHLFGLLVLFGGLFFMIVFLPDISEYIRTQKYLKEQKKEEPIITGQLVCKTEDSSETLDYNYTIKFNFENSKVSDMTTITEIRGDASLDEAELGKLLDECQLLETYTTGVKGVSVSCKLDKGKMTKNQSFEFSQVVVDDAITAFVEAGGSYPNYDDTSLIDDVERDLIATNYTCQRIK